MFTKYKLNDSPSNFRKSHEISASNKLLSSYAQKITWGAQNAPLPGSDRVKEGSNFVGSPNNAKFRLALG